MCVILEKGKVVDAFSGKFMLPVWLRRSNDCAAFSL